MILRRDRSGRWLCAALTAALWQTGALAQPAADQPAANQPAADQTVRPPIAESRPPRCAAKTSGLTGAERDRCFEDRVQLLRLDRLQLLSADHRRLLVSAFALYRIIDRETFEKRVATQEALNARLRAMIASQFRSALGAVAARAIVSSDNVERLAEIRAALAEPSAALGVEIIGLRIQSTKLPAASLQAVWRRMRAERARESAEIIAQAREQAQMRLAVIRREAVAIEAAAKREALEIEAQAIARRARLLAEALAEDPEFAEAYLGLSRSQTGVETPAETPKGGEAE